MIRNLIFDIGGVILDDSDKPLEKFLKLSVDKINGLNQIIYGDLRWKNKVMLGYMSQEQYAEELIGEYYELRNVIKKCLLPQYQPEVLPVLNKNLQYIIALKSSGKYNLYILSNLTSTTHDYLNDILKEFDGGVYSFQEHIKKPDSRIYQTLFSKYNLDPTTCLFFDDRRRNIEAGEVLGMQGVVVSSLEDIKSANLL